MTVTSPAFDTLLARYTAVRGRSLALAAPLSPEDCAAQSMPDASPTKWHLAHTTWFFETFVLEAHEPGFQPFAPAFRVLFNSYYNGVGAKHPRPQRGLLTRPSLEEVLAYRANVDARMARWVPTVAHDDALRGLIELGLQHEQQHQELMLTDILHLLSCNPLFPAYAKASDALAPEAGQALAWHSFDGGLADIGHAGSGFAFDNEGPRHRVYLHPYALASRLVTQAEYLAFVEADLKFAMEHLPIKYSNAADYGRWTKGAAAALLMKMYMHHKRFDKAVAISDTVMTCGYGLVKEYKMIWDINNEGNEECIFVLPCATKPGVNVNIFPFHSLQRDWVWLSGAKVQSADGYRVPWAVYDKFDKEDGRLSCLVKDYYIMRNKVPTLVDGRATGRLRNGAIPVKYGEDPDGDGIMCGIDIVLIRYADILLLRAEALNEVNGVNQESIDLINSVRDRAFNNNPAKRIDISMFPDKESLRDYILQERQFELYMEGERRQDLIRHGKYIQNAHDRGITTAMPHHVRYAIPNWIIIEGQGNIKQNDGY